MEFKVGDLIRGINPDRYTVTNTCMTCGEVVDIGGYADENGYHTRISVKVVEHSTCYFIGDKHWVDPQYFELIERIDIELSEPDYDSLLKLFEEA